MPPKKPNTKRLSPSEEAETEFVKNGPFTIEGLWPLVEIVALHGEEDGLQIGDTLDDIAWKFQGKDFERLLDMKTSLTTEDYDKWQFATDEWELRYVDRRMTDEQLHLIAKSSHFLSVLETIELYHLPCQSKFIILQEYRTYKSNQKKKEKEASAREKSPKRH